MAQRVTSLKILIKGNIRHKSRQNFRYNFFAFSKQERKIMR